jgi:MFS family permease
MSIHNQQRYELTLTFIFFITFGFMLMDRFALPLLAPIMAGDLSLNIQQIGVINMGQTFGYATAIVFGIIADRLGHQSRKPILIASIILTAVFSAGTMLATSYEMLVVIRTLLGIAEAAMFPQLLVIMKASSTPRTFARNMGIVFMGPAIIGQLLGPMIITQLAAATDWRITYLIVSIPTLILGIIAWVVVKGIHNDDVIGGQEDERISWNGVKTLLSYRNIWMCIFICIFGMSMLQLALTYVPNILMGISQLDAGQMGLVMSGIGLTGIIYTFLMPLLSDRIGRRPAVMLIYTFALLAPLSLLVNPYLWPFIIGFAIFGGFTFSSQSFFIGIIPAETIRPSLLATATAIILTCGELIGALMVGVSGRAANIYGLPAVLMIMIGTSIVCILAAALLKETLAAKRQVNQDVLPM